MLTPQEVREQSETFEKAVFGGYSVNSVDDLLGPLTEDYAALYKENTVLKSKMKVLVEQLEKYRQQEESLNKAMVAAQKTADEMVEETERKCAKMLSDTEASLRDRNVDLKRELAAEAERVSRAKKTAAAFIAEMETQVHQSLSQLERIRQMTIVPKNAAKQKKESPAPQPKAEQTSDPGEITRQIERNLKDMLSPKDTQTTEQSVSGDTMVIKPLE